jgi:hypothetical protein
MACAAVRAVARGRPMHTYTHAVATATGSPARAMHAAATCLRSESDAMQCTRT